jgi:hypothetical protein
VNQGNRRGNNGHPEPSHQAARRRVERKGLFSHPRTSSRSQDDGVTGGRTSAWVVVQRHLTGSSAALTARSGPMRSVAGSCRRSPAWPRVKAQAHQAQDVLNKWYGLGAAQSMARSTVVKHKKRGHPATGITPMAGVRLSQRCANKLKRGLPSSRTPPRSGATRRLIEKALAVEPKSRRPGAHKGAGRAHETASTTTDDARDWTATAEQQASRKRRLLKGPKEVVCIRRAHSKDDIEETIRVGCLHWVVEPRGCTGAKCFLLPAH